MEGNMRVAKYFFALILIFLTCVIVSIIGLYYFSSNELGKTYSYAAEKQLDYVLNTLDTKSREIELLATSLVSDSRIRFFEEHINNNNIEEFDKISDIREINEQIRQLRLNSSGIKNISIFWPKIDLDLSTASFEYQKNNSWLEKSLGSISNWDSTGTTLFYSTNYPLLNRAVTDSDYYIQVEMDEAYLKQLIDTVSYSESATTIIVLPDGSIVGNDKNSRLFDEMKKNANQNKTMLEFNNQSYNLIKRKSKKNKSTLISIYNKDDFMETVSKVTLITFVSTFLIIVLGLVLMNFFYRGISSQLKTLLVAFKQVEKGNLDVKITYNQKNEFGYIFGQFNQMISGFKHLLRSLNNEYQRSDLAYRKQLQSQINPHFLYNSLFYIVSVSENPEAVRAMSTHLAEYYRYRTKSKDLVIIEDELHFAKSYLEILAMRKSIQYMILVDEEVINDFILPLLIQPLLENAIQHGIEEKDGAHQVRLEVHEKEEFIKISVEDDGRGLSQVEIKGLMLHISGIQTKDNQASVGLKNVNQRLVNYYGEYSKLNIEKSELLGGLKISFKVRRQM